LSQAELAERLGVSQQAVGRAERVDSNPTVALMDRWARGCGCRFELSFADESSG
jgi:transcriptional regulator with XRE-family HTH domain